ncbi:MAG: hypothetical protein CVU90_04450 [Firmicutes bacterium HGW-Firmicutes-15]|nr:MAG: hypothetical protein CVU90_04450 [Firmicutes bacterium HGW-Firmicutes-15]
MHQRIIESAMKQIQRYGFRKFTIDEIATDIGISKKTVYKYFNGKSEIISTVVDYFLEVAKDKHLEALEIDGGVLEKLNAFLLCPIHDEVPPWLIAEMQQYFPDEWEKVNKFKQFNKDEVVKMLAEGIQEGIFRSDIHPALIEMVWERTIEVIFDSNFTRIHDLTLNQALEMFQTIIYDGIKINMDCEVKKV